MGCDIHIHAQYKRPENESWYTELTSFSGNRHYDMFAELAGVRNYDEITPLFPPRGIPDDGGRMIEYLLSDHDLHTFSWLTLEEFDRVIKRVPDRGPSWDAMVAYGKAFKKKGYLFRFIFCFDN
jgi:hypothetical protein